MKTRTISVHCSDFNALQEAVERDVGEPVAILQILYASDNRCGMRQFDVLCSTADRAPISPAHEHDVYRFWHDSLAGKYVRACTCGARRESVDGETWTAWEAVR